jgi:hexokinase
LKKEGEFIVWDLFIPKKSDKEKSKIFYGITLSINIGQKKIDTGYAITWNREQNYENYVNLGKEVGLMVKDHLRSENTFYIKFVKN